MWSARLLLIAKVGNGVTAATGIVNGVANSALITQRAARDYWIT